MSTVAGTWFDETLPEAARTALIEVGGASDERSVQWNSMKGLVVDDCINI